MSTLLSPDALFARSRSDGEPLDDELSGDDLFGDGSFDSDLLRAESPMPKTLKRKAENQGSKYGAGKAKDRKIAGGKRAPVHDPQHGLNLNDDAIAPAADDIIGNTLDVEQIYDIEGAKKQEAAEEEEAKKIRKDYGKIMKEMRRAPKHFSYANAAALKPSQKFAGLALPPLPAKCSTITSANKAGLTSASTVQVADPPAPPSAGKPNTSSTNDFEDPRLKNPDYFASPDVIGPRPKMISANSRLSGLQGGIRNPLPSGAIMPAFDKVWQKNDEKRMKEAKAFVAPSHYAPFQMCEDVNVRRYDVQNDGRPVPFNREIIKANRNFDHIDVKSLRAWLKIQGQPVTGKKDDLEDRIHDFLMKHRAELDSNYGAPATKKSCAVKVETKVDAKQKVATANVAATPAYTVPTDTAPKDANSQSTGNTPHPPVTASQSTPRLPAVPSITVQHTRPQQPSTIPPMTRVQPGTATPNNMPLFSTPNAKPDTPTMSEIAQAVQRNELGRFKAPQLKEFTRYVLKTPEATSKDKKQDSINHIIIWYDAVKHHPGFASMMAISSANARQYAATPSSPPRSAYTAAPRPYSSGGSLVSQKGYFPKSPVLGGSSPNEPIELD